MLDSRTFCVNPTKAMYGDYKKFGFDENYKLKYSKLFCDTFATDVSYPKTQFYSTAGALCYHCERLPQNFSIFIGKAPSLYVGGHKNFV